MPAWATTESALREPSFADLTISRFRCTLQRVKLSFGCLWALLAALAGCGNSDPKNPGGGGQSPGASGSAAELGGSTSSEAGSDGTPGGRTGVSGGGSSGAGETSAGATNHAGAGATAGGSAQAPPDIPSSTLLSDLDETQQGALCDWHASVFGGYGLSRKCGMGTVVFPADQAACISMTYPAFCKKATVGDFDACVTAEIPGHGCIVTDECRRLSCP